MNSIYETFLFRVAVLENQYRLLLIIMHNFAQNICCIYEFVFCSLPFCSHKFI